MVDHHLFFVMVALCVCESNFKCVIGQKRLTLGKFEFASKEMIGAIGDEARCLDVSGPNPGPRPFDHLYVHTDGAQRVLGHIRDLVHKCHGLIPSLFAHGQNVYTFGQKEHSICTFPTSECNKCNISN